MQDSLAEIRKFILTWHIDYCICFSTIMNGAFRDVKFSILCTPPYNPWKYFLKCALVTWSIVPLISGWDVLFVHELQNEFQIFIATGQFSTSLHPCWRSSSLERAMLFLESSLSILYVYSTHSSLNACLIIQVSKSKKFTLLIWIMMVTYSVTFSESFNDILYFRW